METKSHLESCRRDEFRRSVSYEVYTVISYWHRINKLVFARDVLQNSMFSYISSTSGTLMLQMEVIILYIQRVSVAETFLTSRSLPSQVRE